MRATFVAVAIRLLAVSPASAQPGARDSDESARRVVHLLDYMAVDYPDTVADGAIVDALEYAEQIEFSARVRETLAALGIPDADALAVDAAALEQAIATRAPGAQVSSRARELATTLRDRFGVRALPGSPPDVARGAALYAQVCASCHGPEGRGDGPAGAGLDPPPSNLRDPARMQALSPFALYSTIRYGIAGTGMTPFEAVLDEAAHWDLAFYAASLHATPAERERGAALAAAPARLAAQAGPAGARPIAAGIGAGIVLLAILAALVFRFGRRLPLRAFFAASSGLLYALCIVLAGHGIAALQEAAWLPITIVPGPRIDWLGMHPTLEGLAVQGGLLLAALAAFVKLSGGPRQALGFPLRDSSREGSR